MMNIQYGESKLKTNFEIVGQNAIDVVACGLDKLFAIFNGSNKVYISEWENEIKQWNKITDIRGI